MVCLQQLLVSATVVSMTSSRADIIPKLTSNVTLRCDVKDILLPPSGGLVGRSLPVSSQPVEKRDKAQSTNAMQFILSVMVTKDGQDVASVSEHVPARVLWNNSANVKVAGDLSGTHGYLEVSLQYPDRSQTGQYRCDVTGIDAAGHSDVINSSVTLNEGEVTLDDLVDRLHDHELQIRQKDLTIEALKSNNENQIQAMKKEMSQMSADISQLKHVESGIVKCDVDSGSWTGRSGPVTYEDKTVTFSKNYPSPPIVHVGIRRYDNDEPSGDYFYVEVGHVDNTSFTVQCGKLTRYASLWQLYMTWISVPNVQ